ncbi:hypothetical protein V8E51_007609 [Hyaloscypha variabilis]
MCTIRAAESSVNQTPPYNNLYDVETPPSTQPRRLLSIPNWEVLESQQTTQSWDSRNGPRPVTPVQQDSLFIQPTPPSPLPFSPLSPTCGPPFIPDSQDDSSQALSSQSSSHSSSVMCTQTLDVIEDQIYYAKKQRLTPQKSKTGRHAKLYTPEKTTLKEYCRRVICKKGFSSDPRVIKERLECIEERLTWPCTYAFSGAHTSSYITYKEDSSDRLLLEYIRHNIVDGKKGLSLF